MENPYLKTKIDFDNFYLWEDNADKLWEFIEKKMRAVIREYDEETTKEAFTKRFDEDAWDDFCENREQALKKWG